jgi:hypothetical protein
MSEGSQASTACPTDKNGMKMKTIIKVKWYREAKTELVGKISYSCANYSSQSHTEWPGIEPRVY